MTISIGWIDQHRTFRYRFDKQWTWQELRSARRIAEKIMARTLDDKQEAVDIVIDYSITGNWFPPSSQNSFLSRPQDEPIPEDGRKNTPSQKSKSLIPDICLQEHDDIFVIGTLYIVGNPSSRTTKMFEQMMAPAYEWGHCANIKSSEAVVELNNKDKDKNKMGATQL